MHLCAKHDAYYRPARIMCACGAQKSGPTLEKIRLGRPHPRLCAKCFEATPAGRVRIAAARAERLKLSRRRHRRAKMGATA